MSTQTLLDLDPSNLAHVSICCCHMEEISSDQFLDLGGLEQDVKVSLGG